MTTETFSDFRAARTRLYELEDEYSKANPDDLIAGYYIDWRGGAWVLVFSRDKYSYIYNARARKQLLRAAGVSMGRAGCGSGPYPNSDADEAIGA